MYKVLKTTTIVILRLFVKELVTAVQDGYVEEKESIALLIND